MSYTTDKQEEEQRAMARRSRNLAQLREENGEEENGEEEGDEEGGIMATVKDIWAMDTTAKKVAVGSTAIGGAALIGSWWDG